MRQAAAIAATPAALAGRSVISLAPLPEVNPAASVLGIVVSKKFCSRLR